MRRAGPARPAGRQRSGADRANLGVRRTGLRSRADDRPLRPAGVLPRPSDRLCARLPTSIYIYIYIYGYVHTHTHTHMLICVRVCIIRIHLCKIHQLNRTAAGADPRPVGGNRRPWRVCRGGDAARRRYDSTIMRRECARAPGGSRGDHMCGGKKTGGTKKK